MPAKRLRFMIRAHSRSPEGRQMVAFGMRIGYWPCLDAAFVSIAAGAASWDFWYGYASKS